MLELRGITWDHPCGLAPQLATAAAFERAHGDVRLTWTARSLQAFGDQPIEELAAAYDLLVIDRPFVGAAARSGCLVPLDAHLPPDFLAAQAEQSVGPSHHSYKYGDHQWALAIDAAAQVSAYRPDLLDKLAMPVPRTWDEVLELARRQTGGARVAIPLSPVNAICSFLTLCASHGEPPGAAATHLVSRATAHTAVDLLGRLVAHAHPESLRLDPPRTLERMSHSDEIAYCPLLFGYVTYARPSYAPHPCRFGHIPAPAQGRKPHGSILGGAPGRFRVMPRRSPGLCVRAMGGRP